MAVFTYSNNSGLTLPPGAPGVTSGLASQTLVAYGQVGAVTDVSISLNDLTHTFPDDLDMLLVAPNGANNLLFMSDAGGGNDFLDADLTFSDGAATFLTDSGVIAAGTYRPTTFENTENDATFGTATGGINHAGVGAVTFATAFGGISGNGTWGLFIRDDAGADVGDLAGWSVAVTTTGDQAALSGTAGNDNFALANQGGNSGTFNANGAGVVGFSGINSWAIDGGAGTDTITFAASSGTVYNFDLTTSDLTGIETLTFLDPFINGFATVQLLASEIGGGFAANGTINGVGFGDVTDTLVITMGADTNVSLNAIIFNAFSNALDHVIINGDADAEVITGGSANDIITGNGGDDQIFGVGGNDLINGNDGLDILSGGNGNDTMNGGLGDDELYGVNDHDTLHGDDGNDLVSAGAGNDTAYGGIGNDTVYGAAGVDSLFGQAGVDTMTGGTENDVMYGGDQGDFLYGQDGVDGLYGDNGNDLLSGGNDGDLIYGGANADQLLGGAGNDWLDGGTGNDTMTGGNDADDYYYSDGYQVDTAQGFTDDLDELHLDDLLWGGGLTVAQVLSTYATQTSPGIVTFNFGGGDTLTVINGAGISLVQLTDDIVIV